MYRLQHHRRATVQDVTSPCTPPVRHFNKAHRHAVDRQATDSQDNIANGLSFDDEIPVSNEQPRRMRRLADLIRENNELYNNL